MTTSSLTGLPTQRPNPLDPPLAIAAVRSEDPLTRMTFPDGHLGGLATGHHTVRAVLARPAFSNRIERMHSVIPMTRGLDVRSFPTPPGMFNRMDGEDHARIRRM